MNFDPAKVIKGATELPDGKYYVSSSLEDLQKWVESNDRFMYERYKDNQDSDDEMVSYWLYHYPVDVAEEG